MEDLRAKLAEKVENCWDAYMKRFLSRQPIDILGMIGEIAAAQFCYDQLVHNAGMYSDQLLAHLLRYDDPLEVITELWMEECNIDYSEDFEHALWSAWQYGPEPENGSETQDMTI